MEMIKFATEMVDEAPEVEEPTEEPVVEEPKEKPAEEKPTAEPASKEIESDEEESSENFDNYALEAVDGGYAFYKHY